ncbi:MAG: hypothetical protein M5R36_02375 [Deltaproteobacteria bacterium]|nr:hypothetical protein [Deltaproteobacteria bacterium]
MNASEFISKWNRSELRERQGSQEHFIDLCRLMGHPTPAEDDPEGERFCFERGAAKEGGGDGFADVWKKGFFGWEYKGRHKNLDAAYDQLLRYRNDLENPPLLVVSDMDEIIVRTNYTGTKSARYDVRLSNLTEPRSLEILRHLFFDPDKLRPGAPSTVITEDAARRIGELAVRLRERGLDPAEVARFLDRMVFAMFAEDVGLLPAKLIEGLTKKSRSDPGGFRS